MVLFSIKHIFPAVGSGDEEFLLPGHTGLCKLKEVKLKLLKKKQQLVFELLSCL